MARFVLASSSVNRKEILERAGIEFTVIVSNADESNGPKAPDALVKELSRRKLEAVLPKCESDDLVIAADTVVYIDGEILGKPKDLTDANRFMHLLSGHVHTVFTGVCMAYHGERVSFSQETKVKFYPLTESEIAAYVQSGEPMGKAGGYGIQGPAALFVESIEGDYNNIFGFVFAELRLPAMKAELRTAALTAHAQGCIAKTVPEYLPQTVCEKDGAETALSTYALGVLEAELTDALRKSLNGTAKAFVPLGNLTGLMLLNGRGMKIPVRFSVESAVSVRFESVLTGAGINRTAYRTVLHIEAVLFTAERDGAEPVTVTAAYPVYEAVLAGDVPQYGVVRAG